MPYYSLQSTAPVLQSLMHRLNRNHVNSPTDINMCISFGNIRAYIDMSNKEWEKGGLTSHVLQRDN